VIGAVGSPAWPARTPRWPARAAALGRLGGKGRWHDASRRRSRILATLGPASSTLERIRELAQAGADVFRLNFSHGAHADHAERYRQIRQVEAELGRPIGVLMDLQGPSCGSAAWPAAR
jgi:hypothetical protein